VAKFYPNFLG